jgi:outer membrane protein
MLVLGGVLPQMASAQQLTRFAVVDLSKVYTSFFRESKAVRDFQERSAAVQADIDRMTQQIKSLQSQKADADMSGNTQLSMQLDTEIYNKTNLLKEYYNAKTAELEAQKKKLTSDDQFLGQVMAEVQLVAESEGYSMVLSKTDAKGILWYSPSVDITDKVIQGLLTKAGQ